MQTTSDYLINLWQHQQRCVGLPQALQPASREEAYRVQALMEGQSVFPLQGWKIAATSVAGQKHIGVTGPLAGRYIAERVLPSGGIVPFGRNHMKVVEVEFAFRMGAELSPRNHPYTEEEVFAAVASLHPALEFPDSRYDRFEIVGVDALIADNACADWLVVGEAVPEIWRDMDLAAFSPVGKIAGKEDRIGLGSNVLGSPRIAMTWIANELSSLGISLAKGQLVTTGTCVVPMAIAAQDRVVGDFGVLGRVEAVVGA